MMSRTIRVLLASCLAVALLPLSAQNNAPLPAIVQRGAAKQLIVDGKPFLMLAGELHNSSASSSAYMEPIWPRLKALHLNTVIGTVSWELLEPEEGRFDFTLVDDQITAARRQNMHLVLLWFGSWKNTSSTYVPIWVKRDKKRFQWAQQHEEPTPEHPKRGLYALSAFSTNARDADARAFRALMHHIREVDPEHTVAMMQIENETGILTEGREYSAAAQAAWKGEVPAELISYLVAHKQSLNSEVSDVWSRNSYKTRGTWAEVFGSDRLSEEIFSAWFIGRYVDAVARAGQEELPLPMYANAWLVQNSQQAPGDYPSGGPVSRVMDIWHAAAPSLQLLAPDIYIDDFAGTCASYKRQGNPLFFPESRPIPGNYIWAIGHDNALGVSPFAVDDLKEDDPVGELYKDLDGMAPLLLDAQSKGNVAAVAPRSSGKTTVTLGGFAIDVKYAAMHVSNMVPVAPGVQGSPVVVPDVVVSSAALKAGQTGYGLIVAAAPDEFYILGRGISLTFTRPESEKNDWVLYGLEEGSFQNGKWIAGRHLNGDEGPTLRKLALPEKNLVLYRVRIYEHPGPGSIG